MSQLRKALEDALSDDDMLIALIRQMKKRFYENGLVSSLVYIQLEFMIEEHLAIIMALGRK